MECRLCLSALAQLAFSAASVHSIEGMPYYHITVLQGDLSLIHYRNNDANGIDPRNVM
jgi:hypothetical protein